MKDTLSSKVDVLLLVVNLGVELVVVLNESRLLEGDYTKSEKSY